MKKYLLAFAIFIAPALALAAPPAYVAPSSGTSPIVNFTIEGSATAGVSTFFANGMPVSSNDNIAACGSGTGFTPTTGDGQFDLSILITSYGSCATTTNSSLETYTVVVSDDGAAVCG